MGVGGYRYGFNGKEKDDEGEWGSSTHYDYGFRIYNPGIAKFLSVDPLYNQNLHLSPYIYADNNPIALVDKDGGDGILYIIALGNKQKAKMAVQHAQAIADQLGLNVKVQMFDHGNASDFNSDYLDATDAFAVIGSNPIQVIEYMNSIGVHETADFYAYRKSYELGLEMKGRTRTIEAASTTQRAVVADWNSNAEWHQRLDKESDPNRVMGFTVLHGFGHAVEGLAHGTGEPDDGFMYPGNVLDSKGSIDAVLGYGLNLEVVNRINDRMMNYSWKTEPEITGYESLMGGASETIPRPIKIPRTPTDNYLSNKANQEVNSNGN